MWHQYSIKSASKGRVTVILPAQVLCRERIWYIIGPLWLCCIICLLWLWALWQFVQLELSGRCLFVDFCLTERNLDSERQRDRATECTGGWAVRFWQPFIPPTLNRLTHSQQIHPSFSSLLYCNLHTHTHKDTLFVFLGFTTHPDHY